MLGYSVYNFVVWEINFLFRNKLKKVILFLICYFVAREISKEERSIKGWLIFGYKLVVFKVIGYEKYSFLFFIGWDFRDEIFWDLRFFFDYGFNYIGDCL